MGSSSSPPTWWRTLSFKSRARPRTERPRGGPGGLPEEAFVALFVGKLVPWKRPGDFLEAVARAPGVFAVLAGEGPLRSHLEARASRPDLAGRVRFLGFVNQGGLPGVYSASDVLVLPSEHGMSASASW
jgi:glycosyltransferase involved in cell wall biosynthesis